MRASCRGDWTEKAGPGGSIYKALHAIDGGGIGDGDSAFKLPGLSSRLSDERSIAKTRQKMMLPALSTRQMVRQMVRPSTSTAADALSRHMKRQRQAHTFLGLVPGKMETYTASSSTRDSILEADWDNRFSAPRQRVRPISARVVPSRPASVARSQSPKPFRRRKRKGRVLKQLDHTQSKQQLDAECRTVNSPAGCSTWQHKSADTEKDINSTTTQAEVEKEDEVAAAAKEKEAEEEAAAKKKEAEEEAAAKEKEAEEEAAAKKKEAKEEADNKPHTLFKKAIRVPSSDGPIFLMACVLGYGNERCTVQAMSAQTNQIWSSSFVRRRSQCFSADTVARIISTLM